MTTTSQKPSDASAQNQTEAVPDETLELSPELVAYLRGWSANEQRKTIVERMKRGKELAKARRQAEKEASEQGSN